MGFWSRLSAVEQRLEEHEAAGRERHSENSTKINILMATVARIEQAIAVFQTMLPQLESGIAADEKAIYRRKLLRRVLGTVVITLTTVSTLIPLAQLILGLHIQIWFR